MLAAVGLLGAARRAARGLRLRRTRRYHRLLIAQYRSEFAKLIESYAAFECRETERNRRSVAERFEADRRHLLRFALALYTRSAAADGETERRFLDGLAARYAGSGGHAERIVGALAALAWQQQPGPHAVAQIVATAGGPLATGPLPSAPNHGSAEANFAHDRAALVRAILDRVVDVRIAPCFYDYDYVDDLVGIVGGRYTSVEGADARAIASILDALAVLAGDETTVAWRELPAKVRAVLGERHDYVPARGNVKENVLRVIPDMAQEFIELRAESDPRRFLEINREYSRRQATAQGLWDHRQLSLLRGYERDHHLMLRKLVGLLEQGDLTRTDEVLLIGPRYVDEVDFFRKSLGLPRTVGLDLFEYGRNEILAGDMHDMPFKAGRFKLVYCAGTLSYSYNARKLIDEIARVLTRPGYVFLIDAAGRNAGPDALGRSDSMGVDTLLGMFHRYSFEVIAKDAGRTLAPENYENEPCLALKLRDDVARLADGTQRTRYLARP
jgi:SAM-dependent methyltransferase